MTVLPDLERQLVQAAARATPSARATPPARRRPHGAVALALSLLVALAVGAALLTAGHGRSGQSSARPANATERSLLSILGVLRRPQTRADLPPSIRQQLDRGFFLRMRVDVKLVRRAQTPVGPVFVIPTRCGVTVMQADGGGGGCSDAHWIESGLAQTNLYSYVAGQSVHTLIAIIPDGVARVRFLIPLGDHRLLARPAAVHDNVAVTVLDGWLGNTNLAPMDWYAAAGRLTRRVGYRAPDARISTGLPAGPQTPASRAAEQDPSTPNAVTVTPATGTPSTVFRVHFKILVNGAQYGYALAGPRCASLDKRAGKLVVQRVNAGPRPSGLADLRGRVYDEPITGRFARPCLGTYWISVSTDAGLSAGRHGLSSQPRPFGQARFTVR